MVIKLQWLFFKGIKDIFLNFYQAICISPLFYQGKSKNVYLLEFRLLKMKRTEKNDGRLASI